MKRFITALVFFSQLGSPASTQASTIHVAGDQSGTWSADTVIVTAEVRVPPGQSLTILPGVFVLFQVHVRFIVDNNATLLAVGTVLDSIHFDVLPPNNSWRGIRFLNASASSRLEYCHLTHGNATSLGFEGSGGAVYCSNSNPTIRTSLIDHCVAGSWGGAIFCIENSSPVLNDNVIRGNDSDYGGAIACYENCSPTITNNEIRGNTSYEGGAIYCLTNANPDIIGNIIAENSATSLGGGIFCSGASPLIEENDIRENSAPSGGGLSCWQGSDPTIKANIIADNSASWGGGAIQCWNTSIAVIQGNTMTGNTAYQGGACYFGSGAIPAVFELNEISNNTAQAFGGGFYLSSSVNISMNKCTVVGNTAASGGGLYCYNSTPIIRNSILWDNTPEQVLQVAGGFPPPPPPAPAVITYSDIQGGWSGTGNISADPIFVNATAANYHLQGGSPCINSGDPDPFYNDPDGTRADMGAYYYEQTSSQPPVVSDIPNQTITPSGKFKAIAVDKYVTDPDDPDSTIVWSWSGNSSIVLTWDAVKRGIRVKFRRGWTGSETVIFTATDPDGLSDSDGAIFTVTASAQKALAGPGMEDLPDETLLIGNYPNPFNPSTTFRYGLNEPGIVSLKIYNTLGQLVRTIVDADQTEGYHEAVWDGRNETGSTVSSGIYVYRLVAGEFTQTSRMLLMK